MARKKIEPIESLGAMDKLTVQKSRPLFALWRSELTLAEFKLLDSYLGRINSHDEDHRTVIFSKGELETLFGLKQIKPDVLDERLKHLMISVPIPDNSHKSGFTRISLFEKAYCEQDEYGQWQVELTCTPSAKKYIFGVDEIGYLRYKLRCVINMKSRYTYIMFLYIWDNKHRISWEVSLDDLKTMLRCDEEDTYKEFKRFNDLILKKVHREIHTVTDIKYDYETVKKGRHVVAIRFIYHKVQTVPLEEINPNQIPLDDATAPLLQSACSDEFTGAELEAIEAILRDADIDPGQYGIEIARYHWLEKAYKEFLVAADRSAKIGKPIKHRFTYFKKMLEKRVADFEV